ncbi:MAG: hypothetical protein K1X89_14310 [Myxococcaceae bacterium]|nr:hypothetical protein [Myxococcaceae bacterium]
MVATKVTQKPVQNANTREDRVVAKAPPAAAPKAKKATTNPVVANYHKDTFATSRSAGDAHDHAGPAQLKTAPAKTAPVTSKSSARSQGDAHDHAGPAQLKTAPTKTAPVTAKPSARSQGDAHDRPGPAQLKNTTPASDAANPLKQPIGKLGQINLADGDDDDLDFGKGDPNPEPIFVPQPDPGPIHVPVEPGPLEDPPPYEHEPLFPIWNPL